MTPWHAGTVNDPAGDALSGPIVCCAVAAPGHRAYQTPRHAGTLCLQMPGQLSRDAWEAQALSGPSRAIDAVTDAWAIKPVEFRPRTLDTCEAVCCYIRHAVIAFSLCNRLCVCQPGHLLSRRVTASRHVLVRPGIKNAYWFWFMAFSMPFAT